MGMYLNPGNSGFEEIRNSSYVDKSGMISLINATIGTKQKLTCVSRPRRFGKSFAAQIEKIHEEETAILFYNNEQSLRSVIKLAYFSYRDYYVKFEELPSGNGYADLVYLPKKLSPVPALLIELKWNRSAEGAIRQIKDKHYPAALNGYGGVLLLVGIAYDRDGKGEGKRHTCSIEKVCLDCS